MLRTWQNADVSQQEPYNGDFKAAMQAIMAKALILPAKTDLYFPYVDRLSANKWEARLT
jgi:homoserine O-acetyltransferase